MMKNPLKKDVATTWHLNKPIMSNERIGAMRKPYSDPTGNNPPRTMPFVSPPSWMNP